MTPGAVSCRQDRSPASRRRSQWNPGKNISKVHLQLKNTERAVACAALRTAFQNMDPEKEVFLSSEQTVLISFTEHQHSKAGSKSVRFAALALPFDAVVTSCKSAAAGAPLPPPKTHLVKACNETGDLFVFGTRSFSITAMFPSLAASRSSCSLGMSLLRSGRQNYEEVVQAQKFDLPTSGRHVCFLFDTTGKAATPDMHRAADACGGKFEL
ncbi:hypothetical protein Bbelb_094570 [Branchiostoma belcheri]|nr:hypothetical protein Bbelb_094570 [Branchiostoma belcheri]